jgi:hypothetical protein
MRKILLFGLIGLLAVAIVAPPARAVPLFPNVPNTFGGAAVAEDAGYAGAAAGTQAALYNFAGSEVSLTAGAGAINLPQAAILFDTDGDGDVDSDDAPVPTPAAAIYETTQVKDGASVSFGQEMTAVLGGLFPTAVVAPGAVDNGAAPGSTAADGNPDQLALPAAPGPVGVSYSITFGPGTLSPFPFGRPVFEIYEDVPPGLDLDIGAGTTTLVEEEFDFDGAGVGPAGPTTPPPTASPSQFENTADGFPAPNNVTAATDGPLFASGWIDTLVATYNFYSTSVLGSALGAGPNGGAVYEVSITGKGVVTDGSILDLLLPLEVGGAFDGSDINITFAATLYGEAFAAGSVPQGDPLGTDPFAAWNLRTSLAGNSGDASFTIIPTIPEPTTLALLGIGLVPLALRRRKRA